MSLAFRAFFIAIFAVMKRWKVVFLLFIFNFLFSIFLGIPLFKAISTQVGRFGGLDGFLKNFDPALLGDFTLNNTMVLDGFLLSAGIGGILYFLLFHCLSCGMISILADPRENVILKTFFKATGKYAFRFIRLLFYYALFLALLTLINLGLDLAIQWFFTDLKGASSESPFMGWIFLCKNILMLLLFVYVLLSFNYAKTLAVVEDRHFMGSCFFSGLGFVLVHPLVTGIFFLLSGLSFVLVYYLYGLLSRMIDVNEYVYILDSIGGVTLSSAFIFFILCQAVQIFAQASIVLRHAGQVYIYKYLTVRTINEDPELRSPDPYSPFIPDSPMKITDPNAAANQSKEGQKNG